MSDAKGQRSFHIYDSPHAHPRRFAAIVFVACLSLVIIAITIAYMSVEEQTVRLIVQ